jgi:hypothetical protein
MPTKVPKEQISNSNHHPKKPSPAYLVECRRPKTNVLRVGQGRDEEVATVRQVDCPQDKLALVVCIPFPMQEVELTLAHRANGEDKLE